MLYFLFLFHLIIYILKYLSNYINCIPSKQFDYYTVKHQYKTLKVQL